MSWVSRYKPYMPWWIINNTTTKSFSPSYCLKNKRTQHKLFVKYSYMKFKYLFEVLQPGKVLHLKTNHHVSKENVGCYCSIHEFLDDFSDWLLLITYQQKNAQLCCYRQQKNLNIFIWSWWIVLLLLGTIFFQQCLEVNPLKFVDNFFKDGSQGPFISWQYIITSLPRLQDSHIRFTNAPQQLQNCFTFGLVISFEIKAWRKLFKSVCMVKVGTNGYYFIVLVTLFYIRKLINLRLPNFCIKFPQLMFLNREDFTKPERNKS